MAAAGLLALLDDIATILDDVAILTKASAKQTSGIVTDDLVVTAEQVRGVASKKEIPIIMKVAVGSLINKAILIPLALLISAILPMLITPILVIGAGYLCYEGAEKVIHSLHTKKHSAAEAAQNIEQLIHEVEPSKSQAAPNAPEATTAAAVPHDDILLSLSDLEKQKIKTAIRTDFILSGEIIIIALNVVADAPFTNQVVSLIAIGLFMTVLVYGAVAALVKLDDLGLFLIARSKTASALDTARRKIGQGLLLVAAKIMGALSVIGTLAMLLVGGEIVNHAFHAITETVDHIAQSVQGIAFIGSVLGFSLPIIANLLIGLIYGVLVIGVFHHLIPRVTGKKLSGEKPAGKKSG